MAVHWILEGVCFPCCYIVAWGGIRQKKAHFRELHLWHIGLTSVRSNRACDHLYFGCHSNGLGKASSTASHGQDQDSSAEVPPWLMISSWKLFYVGSEDQSCSGTHSSHFCNLIFPSIPTYKQTEDLKVSKVFLTFLFCFVLVKVHCKISLP